MGRASGLGLARDRPSPRRSDVVIDATCAWIRAVRIDSGVHANELIDQSLQAVERRQVAEKLQRQTVPVRRYTPRSPGAAARARSGSRIVGARSAD